MFIRFNYRCPCGVEEERFVKKSEMDEQYCHKTHLIEPGETPKPMTRLPAAPVTHFRFADKKLKR